MKAEDQECCPKFDPNKWNNKTFIWDKKPFIKESVPTLFHIPLPSMIGKKMKKMMDLVEEAGANIPDITDALVLFHDPSLFKSDIYYSVTQNVAEANNTTLSGTFIAEVFEGPYNAIPKHIKTMDKHLARENLKARDYYVHYTYCPKCAKKFGNNFKILFAEV